MLANSADEWDRLLAGGDYFAVLAQYPPTSGSIHDLRADAARIHAHDAAFIVAADLLALTLLVPPGEFGADIVSATPSASACRWAPAARTPPTWPAATSSSAPCPAGWSASASTATASRPTGWRCRRASSTSAARRPPRNICTAQVLLAVMASMYAVYHGPEGLKRIAAARGQLHRDPGARACASWA